MKNPIKKLLMATALCTSLSACGGGGGAGGAVGTVQNWVNEDLSNLSGATSNINYWNNILQDYLSSTSSSASVQSILTGPSEEDRAKAQTLLTILQQANEAWENSNNIIDGLSDSEKYAELNKTSYKEAYQAIQFLNNNVKPLVQKVASGESLSVTEFNSMDSRDEGQKIMDTYDAESFVAEKSVKTFEKDVEVNGPSHGTSAEYEDTDSATTSNSDHPPTNWTTINLKGGQQSRTVYKVTPIYKNITTQVCKFDRTTKLNGDVVEGTQVCPAPSVEKVFVRNDITEVTEYRDGDNPVLDGYPVKVGDWVEKEETIDLDASQRITNGGQTAGETILDTSVVGTTQYNDEEVTIVDNGNGTSTETKKTWKYTVTTKNWKKQDFEWITTEEKKKEKFRKIKERTQTWTYKYLDNSTEDIVQEKETEVVQNWEPRHVGDYEEVSKVKSEPAEWLTTWTTTHKIDVDGSVQTTQQTYPNDENPNLGTQTANMSAIVNDHKTSEYNNSTGLNMINAAEAYAKGWTGKGAVLGVVDTWQQTDHPELDGKYKYYKNYTRQTDTDGDGVYDSRIEPDKTQIHGTHVAGIIAGKRDGSGTHGVAFDAELVGANIDKYANGNVSKSEAQNAVHDFAKLKDPNGENMNIVAVNMSFNNELHYLTDRGNYNVTQLSDGTFNAPKVTEYINNNNRGQATYWKVATDNDIILVNSAGNSQYIGDHVPADPGIWAVETDANGELILGGKMIIVGNWTGTGVSGNKAGHICMSIVDNKCNDTNKISDFYILAPGMNINSTVPTDSGNSYMNMSGTSMAAPHVTGAFGIINQMWPHMKGDSLVKLLLNTADKDLKDGNNNLVYDVNIHGQGLLDLNEATKPQGAVGLNLTGRTNGPIIGVQGTYFATGTALPSNLKNLNIMVLDEYERDYYMNLGSSFTVKDNRKVSDIDVMMKGHTYLPIQSMYGNFAQGGNYDLGYMNFGVYTGESGNGDFSANIGKDFMLSDKFKLKTSIGQMNEQDNWLGNSSDGVLAVGDNNVTNFGQFGIEYQLGNNVLSFDYSKGFTDINTTDNSLITGFNNVETESMKLAYEIHRDQNNSWGFSLSTPSHITKGTMNLMVPESRTLDGTVNYTNIESDLSSGKIEKDIGFFFSHTPTDDMDASFNFKAEYRQDIAGVDGQDGVNLAFNYVKKLNTNCKFLWMKNPKCYEKDSNGKQVLKANLYDDRNNNSIALTHGLVYDLETDKFVPIKKK